MAFGFKFSVALLNHKQVSALNVCRRPRPKALRQEKANVEMFPFKCRQTLAEHVYSGLRFYQDMISNAIQTHGNLYQYYL